MNSKFKEMLKQLDTGAFVYVEPSEDLLKFNDFLERAGYSVARLEVVKVRGEKTGRRFEYDFLANRQDSEAWQIFVDPGRSAANVRSIVYRAIREGGEFRFLVWAEEPPSEK